jgi:HD-GYP domain-containing protein (c-di-GMP phosphodiesterase class II)
MELTDPTLLALNSYTKALSAALGYRDVSTRLHSDRVTRLSHAIGVSIGLSENELGMLNIAASFHDVGKIGISDAILLKPSAHSEAERIEMRRHTEIGEKIIAATEIEGAQQAAFNIRAHHENFDGSGYPDQLAGEEIPLFARIISIADSYDAMAETRVHHRARSHSAIMAILDEETGHKHDPALMRRFSVLIATSGLKATEQ